MPANLMTQAEKEQLIRVLLSSQGGHTSVLSLKLNTPDCAQLLDTPLGHNTVCSSQTKEQFQTWLLMHVKHCYEKETAESVHNNKQDSYETALTQIQATLHQTWDTLFLFCREKLKGAEESDLITLTQIGELSLAPYYRNDKMNIIHLSDDMQALYLRVETESKHLLTPLLNQHKQEVMEWFYDFTAAISYQTANEHLNPQQNLIAHWLENRNQQTKTFAREKDADLILLGKQLVADLNGAVNAINLDFQKHRIQSLFFRAEAKLAKGLREIIHKHPEFYCVEASQLPEVVQNKELFKPILTVDNSGTIIDVIVQVRHRGSR